MLGGGGVELSGGQVGGSRGSLPASFSFSLSLFSLAAFLTNFLFLLSSFSADEVVYVQGGSFQLNQDDIQLREGEDVNAAVERVMQKIMVDTEQNRHKKVHVKMQKEKTMALMKSQRVGFL